MFCFTKNIFMTTANEFNSMKMKKFNNYEVDDWKAKERYLVAYNTLKEYKNNY